MNLYEYQGRELFAGYGLPVPEGGVADSPEAARRLADELGSAVVVKAQVLTGGRGKAGGVKLAADPDEAEARARDILGMEIKGHLVERVLVAPAVDIKREIYLGVTFDRALRAPVIMCSGEGGVDIETVAAERPEAIVKTAVDPGLGVRPFQVRKIAHAIDLPAELHRPFGSLVGDLVRAYLGSDASLVEINPLVITADGQLQAIDSKVTIDDSALFRQQDLAKLANDSGLTGAELAAREAGLSYVDLDGSIGCLVNGAGLAMATMDVIKLFGGEPANFLDIGGGAQADKVEAAMRIILADSRVKSVLINIFGGITRGDEVARGILSATAKIDSGVPFIVRIVGTNAQAARAILAEANMRTAGSLAEAARMAVEAAGFEVGEVA